MRLEAYIARYHGDAHLWLETVPLVMLLAQCILGLLLPDICWQPAVRAGGLGLGFGRPVACRHAPLEPLLGRWKMHERHNMDAFLEGLGFNGLVRGFLLKAGQEQLIAYSEEGDRMRVLTSDMRGTS